MFQIRMKSRRFLHKSLTELGRIDVLVNNAGYGVFNAAHEAEMDDVKGMFDVNVVGLIACTSMVLPHDETKKWTYY